VARLSLKVGSIYCYDCVLGLRGFLSKIKGVQSVDMVGDDRVVTTYNPSDLEIDEEKLQQIVRDSIDKLGFKVIDT
jgi:hypothetical protein